MIVKTMLRRTVTAGLTAGLLLSVSSARADEPTAPAPEAPVAAAPDPAPTAAPAAPRQMAMADTPAVAASAPPPVPAVPAAPPPPPYSLPWQLRPVTVGNVIRLDTATAFYEDAMGNTGSTVASTLLASYKITPEIAPMIRMGFSRNDAPAAGAAGPPTRGS
jgi:hypothetical protein